MVGRIGADQLLRGVQGLRLNILALLGGGPKGDLARLSMEVLADAYHVVEEMTAKSGLSR